MYRYDLNPVDSSASANIVEQSVFGQAHARPSGNWPVMSSSPENQAACNTWGPPLGIKTDQHKANQSLAGSPDQNNNSEPVTMAAAEAGQGPADRVTRLAAAPLSTSVVPPKTRLRRQTVASPDPGQQEDQRPYIKKPQNAFMLFLEEKRPGVMQEHNIRNSALVNKVMGQMWNSLSSEEQATYYERASDTRRQHREQHPNWSYRDNYRRKYKQRRKGPRRAASATEAEPDQERTLLQDLDETGGSPEHSSREEDHCAAATMTSSQVPRADTAGGHRATQ
ncbi:transcription factor 7-like 1-B isoform X2 [Synchiropus splendidus]|uniref:transcription factor 7-like 1-B isoform X2 n=1 Tax=Synchiropus splendidus TaxID=270530 RepID=UPI00237E6BD7|nr:transcription factor 7-like 1-B isoform X2 [Synchiropus splendidus]